MERKRFWIWPALLVFSLASQMPRSSAQQTDTFFTNKQPLELTITTDLKALLRQRPRVDGKQSASLLYTRPDGSKGELAVALKKRGKSRLNSGVCDFPLLWISFDQNSTPQTPFASWKKLKMVTRCLLEEKNGDQHLLREYLVYEAYRLFTDYSYGVRLARVTFQDSKEKTRPLEQFLFFLEPDKVLAARKGGLLVNRKYVDQRQTESQIMAITELFQYMAGNVDWSVPALHNMKLVFSAASPSPVAVPYDFDLSGLVNPPYQTGEKAREFRGFERPPADWLRAVKVFLEKKEAILTLYRDFPHLQPDQREECLAYLNSFYALLEQPEDKLLGFLAQACRKE